MMRRAIAIVLVVGCGGVVSQTDAGVDAAKPVDGSTPDAACVKQDSGCSTVPLACCNPPPTTLSESLAPFAGLSPTDPCPDNTTWTERYDSCGLTAIHGFAEPPVTHWFNTNSGELVGISSSSDTGCSGCGVVDFPCDGIVTCQHLCGSFTGTIEPPHCPPSVDAGTD